MRPVRRAGGLRAGFTLMEALIALAILGILLALGMPNLLLWLAATRARGAAEFYAEGFKLARAEALRHNSASRLLLSANANGQMDWQVDLCFPSVVKCSDDSGAWSSRSANAGLDPEGANGFKSVFRGADGLPGSAVLALTRSPAGATDVYFTALGWIDATMAPMLRRVDLAPAPGHAGAFPGAAVLITQAGMAIQCDPAAAASDSRACPP